MSKHYHFRDINDLLSNIRLFFYFQFFCFTSDPLGASQTCLTTDEGLTVQTSLYCLAHVWLHPAVSPIIFYYQLELTQMVSSQSLCDHWFGVSVNQERNGKWIPFYFIWPEHWRVRTRRQIYEKQSVPRYWRGEPPPPSHCHSLQGRGHVEAGNTRPLGLSSESPWSEGSNTFNYIYSHLLEVRLYL